MLVGLNRLPAVRGTRAIQNQMLAMSGLINNGSRRLRLGLQARMRRSGIHGTHSRLRRLCRFQSSGSPGQLGASSYVKCQAVSMDLQIAESAIKSAGANGCN